jgi:parvulin-like peptidyl-prolyl isomerase
MKRLLIVGVIFLLACKGEEKGVVARVGDARLTEAELASLSPPGVMLDEVTRQGFIEQWMHAELLAQEARRQGIDKDLEVKARLRQMERQYLANELLQRQAQEIVVAPQEVQDYFNRYQDQFLYQVKVVQIILPDSISAQRTLADLAAGADFQRLAQERSLDRAYTQGQPSEYFPRGTGDPALEEAIFAMSAGEVSPILRALDGYHIVKLVDRKKVKRSVDFSEVADYIYQALYFKKGRAQVERLIEELKAKTPVEVYPLPDSIG